MPTNMRRVSVIVALSCAASSVALGQAAKKSDATCKVNPGHAWVKRQAEWFDESKHDWTNDTLRTALLAAAGLKAPLLAPVQKGVRFEGRDPALGSTADAMIAELKKLAAVRGSPWPTKSAVGATGAHAVFLLAQRDTALGRVALHRLMEAGPDESPAADVATLEDQLRLVWGRKQLYGTQFERDASGKVSLRPMEDSAHADLRREGAGLPPFKLGLCLAKK
ncbi:MAG TPA: hypothetical protein VIP11_11975 [Gemmatimonadaceae bacterium]